MGITASILTAIGLLVIGTGVYLLAGAAWMLVIVGVLVLASGWMMSLGSSMMREIDFER